ncbi:hypothetical protein PN419_00540 [Halorubrum ezzemoulense]|nr:hypothetical protein [Halorubrum ezzemoulense]MDB9247495.1 hypothetical protein [Halorubrum ezzemoulense]MDB9258596.1 hypothetical protein [Halorubrum ezzemoulense]MDB9264545.1 hypothetical protein [Halorubrum ezzemoulense]MDB9268957.1 hypothetical protein [Halorubrum ezzemoulense]MDB9271513.1 hypothetical protein [Halorubrum ezzemoulense]
MTDQCNYDGCTNMAVVDWGCCWECFVEHQMVDIDELADELDNE